MPKNLRFSEIFMGYGNETLVWNWLIPLSHKNLPSWTTQIIVRNEEWVEIKTRLKSCADDQHANPLKSFWAITRVAPASLRGLTKPLKLC